MAKRGGILIPPFFFLFLGNNAARTGYEISRDSAEVTSVTYGVRPMRLSRLR